MATLPIAGVLSRQLQFLSVLKLRDFRIFWFALLSQVSAQQAMMFTLGWLAFDLTGSPLALGYVNIAMSGPRIVLSQVGGVFADRLDQRLLLAISQSASALFLLLLAVLTLTDNVALWHLIVIPIIVSSFMAFDNPARQALFPHLLPDRSRIPDAVPVMASTWQLARVVSPAVAGYLVAYLSAGSAFLLCAIGFGFTAAVMRLLRIKSVRRAGKGSVLQNMLEGAQYVWRNPTFRPVITMTYLTSLFGMGYMFMMPIVAADMLGIQADGLGLLLSAGGVGAVLGALSGPRFIKELPAGKMLLGQLVLFGALLLALAVNRSYLVAVPIMLLLGLASLMFMISSEAVVQTLVEDHVRGRVMAFVTVTWALNPLGAAILSAVADFTGAPFALGLGAGLVVLNAVAVALTSPVVRGLPPLNVVAQRRAAAEAAATPAPH